MYDAEYIRELTAARKANEVARALIKDHEQTIVAQRAELEKLRADREIDKGQIANEKRWRKAAEQRECELAAELAALRAEREAR